MKLSDWLIVFATFFGGGIIGFALENLRNLGKLKIEYSIVNILYTTLHYQHFIQKANVQMQLINTSGHQKVLSNLSVVLIANDIKTSLFFDNHSLPPAVIIEAHSVKECSYTSSSAKGVALPILDILDGQFSAEVFYKLGKKSYNFYIPASSFRLINNTQTWSVIEIEI